MKTNHDEADPELSVNDVALKIKYWHSYFLHHWKIIILITFLGGCAGLAYALIKKPVYSAVSTFVVLDDESSNLSQYAGLASMMGIDLNGGTNGLFSGDNIVELYKSRDMLTKTLLSKGLFANKQELLVDRYIEYNGLRQKWKSKPNLYNISFTSDTANHTILQDSILFDIAKKIGIKNLSVAKPDKKLSIIKVQVNSEDEMFAKYFNENLVKNVNDLYITTRASKSLKNLRILTKQTDSTRRALDLSITGTAAANDAAPNANPNRSILHTGSQRKAVDVQAGGAVYAELMKNVELAKISVQKETPLIQVIDKPYLPLDEEKPGKIISLFAGLFIAFCGASFYLFLKKLF